MTASNYMPDVSVEIAFDSGFSTVTSQRNYTDVSAYVELGAGINITHGRGDEFSVSEPNKLSLTLDNTDGRFTAGKGSTVSRTNIGTNPRAISIGGGWTSTYAGIFDTAFVTTGFPAHPMGITTALRSNLLSGQTNFEAMNISDIDNLGATGPARRVGVWVCSMQAGYQVNFFGDYPVTPLTAGVWTFVKTTTLAVNAIAFLSVGTLTGAVSTDLVYATGSVTEAGDTVGDYFDGSTPASGQLTYAWTGDVNASTSTESTYPPYYPNVKIGRPIRVRSRWPVGTAGNMHPNPSVETNIAYWFTTITDTSFPASSVVQSATRAFIGTKSVLATWMTSALGCNAGANVSGHVIGRTYIASMYVYVPTGSPNVRLKPGTASPSAYTSLKDQWVRLSATYAPSGDSVYISVESAASTAGQTCYIDAAMVDEGTTLQTYTATPPPISDRFVGYVDEWPVEWPGTDSSALARITASSRMARLGFDAELRSTIEEQYLLEAFTRGSVQPVYFPLGEPTDSTTATDITKNGTGRLAKVQLGAGGEVNFGANTGPGTDSLPAPAFLPVNVTNGLYLSGDVGVGYPFTLESFVLTSAAVQQTVVRLRDPGKSWIELSTTSTGKIRASDFNALSGAAFFTLTSPLSYNDGATHHAAVSLSQSAGTITVKLFVDGVNVANTSYATTVVCTYTEMNVGGNSSGALFTGTIAHVAAFAQANDVTRILLHATAGLTGFAGETATQRIVRLAGYALIPAAEVSGDAGTGNVAHIDTTGRTALDSMRAVEATESGVLYDARDNTLTFKGRAARYNVAPEFTLSATAQQVEAGIAPSVDRSALMNDVTGTAADGTTGRAVNQTSIDNYGYARSSVEVAGSTDDALQAAAWRVNTYGEPLPRIPSLGVDFLPLSAGLQASLLSAGVGTRFTLAGLPAQAQSASVDFFIEGYTESIGPESYAFTFNLSPVTGFDVWTIEDPVFGQYDAYPLAL